MRKTKLLTSIAAFALVLGLGACNETTDEKSEQETSSESESETEVKEIVFGFELDGVLNAIDGGYLLKDDGSPYVYEFTYTSNLDDALKFTYEAGEAVGEYYIYTEIDGVTTWVAIVTSGSFTNVNYVTDKTPLYWNPTYECWGNETQTHFLCQNATFGCFYCSEITSWIDSSPIAALYYTDGSKVTGFVGEVYEAEPGYTLAGDPDDLNSATLLGTFDLSKSTTEASTNVLTAETGLAALNTSWDATSGSVTTSPLSSVTNISRAYKGAGGSTTGTNPNTGLQLSAACIKFGNSSNGGEFTLTFTGISVSHIVVSATSWNSGNEATLVANGLGRVVTQSAADLSEASSVSTYQYDFEDGTSELTLSTVESGKRALIFSIALYADVAE